MDLGERGGEKEGLGRVEEGESVVGMEYMREEEEIRKKEVRMWLNNPKLCFINFSMFIEVEILVY